MGAAGFEPATCAGAGLVPNDRRGMGAKSQRLRSARGAPLCWPGSRGARPPIKGCLRGDSDAGRHVVLDRQIVALQREAYALLGELYQQAKDSQKAAATYLQAAKDERLPEPIRQQFAERARELRP